MKIYRLKVTEAKVRPNVRRLGVRDVAGPRVKRWTLDVLANSLEEAQEVARGYAGSKEVIFHTLEELEAVPQVLRNHDE